MSGNAVATPHILSAEAGRHALVNGGNAVDAAIAAVAAQGVVAPETCGVGGDLFALIHSPGWPVPRAINASGRAGSKADPAMLRDAGISQVPRDHPLTVTIPGCVDGLVELSASLGRLTLAECLDPAITIAREGFQASTEQSAAFTRMAPFYRDNPAVAEFYPGGVPVQVGDLVRRPALAETLEKVAAEGRDGFYLGKAGEDIMSAVGGLITPDDMVALQADWIGPIGVAIGGLTAWTTPPNSQGYLGPGALAVFTSLDPPDDLSDPLWWHLLIESYRCLAWQRDDIVADPRDAMPARLLLHPLRLEEAAASVDRRRAGVWPKPMGVASDTAYICSADDTGMAVSIIQSNYRGTGSVFGAERSGFLLQDRGGGFNLLPGHPNELAAGKRPMHTLSPTLWTEGTRARWVLGTRGGAVQPQLVAQMAARAILGDAGLDVSQAAPRWTVQDVGPNKGSSLAVEPGLGPDIRAGLEERGHVVEETDGPQPGWGPISLIELDGETRRTARDPRVDTTAAIVF